MQPNRNDDLDINRDNDETQDGTQQRQTQRGQGSQQRQSGQGQKGESGYSGAEGSRGGEDRDLQEEDRNPESGESRGQGPRDRQNTSSDL